MEYCRLFDGHNKTGKEGQSKAKGEVMKFSFQIFSRWFCTRWNNWILLRAFHSPCCRRSMFFSRTRFRESHNVRRDIRCLYRIWGGSFLRNPQIPVYTAIRFCLCRRWWDRYRWYIRHLSSWYFHTFLALWQQTLLFSFWFTPPNFLLPVSAKAEKHRTVISNPVPMMFAYVNERRKSVRERGV